MMPNPFVLTGLVVSALVVFLWLSEVSPVELLIDLLITATIVVFVVVALSVTLLVGLVVAALVWGFIVHTTGVNPDRVAVLVLSVFPLVAVWVVWSCLP